MSAKKYACNLCSAGTTKNNYESQGCCAKCKEKIERAKKSGKLCCNCKQSDNELFIKFNGLCVSCNNKRCGISSSETGEVKEPVQDEPELPIEGGPGSDSEDVKTRTKKELVDELLSIIVQSYAELGIDKTISRQGFVLSLKTSVIEILENELNNV